MTTITINGNDINVNGRKSYNGRIDAISKTGPGKWEGTASGAAFTIVGGGPAGGYSNEWHLNWEYAYGDQWISLKSAKECVRFINEA
tara:strand:+ start:869 stop:1129 length:261 start_codon:yes stop_codon:yes gene_type:complete